MFLVILGNVNSDNPGQNLLRQYIRHIFNLNVSKQRVKTFGHTPLPHTMLLLAGTFCSTLNGGGGAWNFTRTTNLREVILFSTIVSTLLSKIVGYL